MRRSSGRIGGVLLAAVLTLVGVAPVATAAPTDTAPPVLRGVSISSSVATPGDVLTISVDATDDASGLGSLVVWWSNADVVAGTKAISVNLTTGQQSLAIAPTDSNGQWRLRSVQMRDKAYNTAVYDVSGTLTAGPPGGPKTVSTHDVDMGAAFVVSGARDDIAPSLTSVSVSPSPAHPGDPVDVQWEALPGSHPLSKVTFTWADTKGDIVRVASMPAVGNRGSLSVVAPDEGGLKRLVSVTVADTAGWSALYEPARVTQTSPYSSHRLTPTIDIAAADLRVLPPKPWTYTRVHPRSVNLYLEGSLSSAVTALRVTTPDGQTRGIAPDDTGAASTVVDGLVTGQAYPVVVTAVNAFGESRPTRLTLTPRMSPNIAVIPSIRGVRAPDIVGYARAMDLGPLRRYATDGHGRILPPRPYAQEESCARIAPADVFDLGRGEVLCLTLWGDAMAVEPEGGGFVVGGSGWATMLFADGGYDLSGDGIPDTFSVDATGTMRIHVQNNTGQASTVRKLGSGWSSMLAVVSVGDLDGDRANDVVAVTRAGTLVLYPGTGRGAFRAARTIGSGWNTFGSVFAMRDMTGDGRVDLGAVTMDGRLLVYPGTGRGTLRSGLQIGRGWQAYL